MHRAHRAEESALYDSVHRPISASWTQQTTATSVQDGDASLECGYARPEGQNCADPRTANPGDGGAGGKCTAASPRLWYPHHLD